MANIGRRASARAGLAPFNALPSTSLLDWLKLLMHEDLPIEVLRNRDTKSLIPPLHGAFLKNEADVMRFERFTFISRRENA